MDTVNKKLPSLGTQNTILVILDSEYVLNIIRIMFIYVLPCDWNGCGNPNLGEYTDCNHPIGKTYTIKLQVLDHFICMHLVYLVEAVY